MDSKAEQEMMFKFQMFEQQIQQIREQLHAVDHAILDIQELNLGLEELKGKTGKEILAPIGRGIFVNTKLLSEELIVDVGSGNFVKKSISDTKKIIEEQLKKLNQVKKDLEKSLDDINSEITKIFMESQQASEKIEDIEKTKKEKKEVIKRNNS